MNNDLWIYWVILGSFTVFPFLMSYIEYQAHRNSLKHALNCPVLWIMTGASVVALMVAIHFYPSGMGMISVFIFAMGLPLASAASELPSANRAPEISRS